MWICTWCGGGAEDEEALLDHQEWCLGEAVANTRLLKEVAERDGELQSRGSRFGRAQERGSERKNVPGSGARTFL